MEIRNIRFRNHWAHWTLLILTQILFFILLHAVSYRLYSGLIGNVSPDLSWGIHVQYVLILYIVTAVMIGSASLLLKNLPTLAWLILESFILTFICLSQLYYRPYRSMLLLVDALISIFLAFVVVEVIFRLRQHNFR